MRWHVHGTDATTGHDVVLALDEPEATQAVQVAIAKRILVSHVTRDAGEGLRRMLLPVACVAIVVLIPLCIAVYAQNLSIRAKLSQAVIQQSHLAQSIAQAERLVSQLRTANTNEGASAETTAKTRELADQLAAARSRMSLTEQQLSSVHQRIEALESAAAQVPGLQSELDAATAALKAAEKEVRRLSGESARQQVKLQALAGLPEDAAEKIQNLEESNKALAGQLDIVKSQLLVAAAKSLPEPPATNPDDDPPPGPTAAPARWALRTGYDPALQFMSLHFDRQTFAMMPAGEGVFVSSAARPGNAVTLRFVHDREKERVYAATLGIALGSGGGGGGGVDAPPDKLAENTAMMVLFMKTFAPSFKDPQGALAPVLAQLAGRDASERLVLLGDEYKLTVWTTGPGVFDFKIESPRADAED